MSISGNPTEVGPYKVYSILNRLIGRSRFFTPTTFPTGLFRPYESKVTLVVQNASRFSFRTVRELIHSVASDGFRFRQNPTVNHKIIRKWHFLTWVPQFISLVCKQMQKTDTFDSQQLRHALEAQSIVPNFTFG